MQIEMETTISGIKNGFSRLERIKNESVGPLNIHTKDNPKVLSPLINRLLSVLSFAILVIFNSLTHTPKSGKKRCR